MGLANIKNCETTETELREVLDFLRKRFEEHRNIYGTSFAQQLNNEAAVEIAEVIFSPEMVVQARKHLKEDRELSDLGT
jgi:hypothetical protein